MNRPRSKVGKCGAASLGRARELEQPSLFFHGHSQPSPKSRRCTHTAPQSAAKSLSSSCCMLCRRRRCWPGAPWGDARAPGGGQGQLAAVQFLAEAHPSALTARDRRVAHYASPMAGGAQQQHNRAPDGAGDFRSWLRLRPARGAQQREGR